ncbi:MAG: DUF3352 domain-containing protein [Gemmatimonadetes bacterium]|nr:DUF3352 domain-containing protein [Gemmatimonadota bacterium]
MSFLARATWLGLALFLAVPGCRKKEEGPEAARPGAARAGSVETEAVAGDLPAGATVVVSVHDLESFWTRIKATQFYTQLAAIPEVRQRMRPALAQTSQRFQALAGVPLNEQTLFQTLGDKVQIGVYAGGGGASDTTQRVVVVADMGDKDAMGSILANLRRAAQDSLQTKFTSETYKGVEVTVVSSPENQVRGLYGFHREKLVLSSDQAGFQSAVDALDGGEAGTMASDTLYQRALTHVGEASITLFVNRGGVRGLMGSMQKARSAAGDSAPVTDEMLDVMDKYNIQSATVAGTQWTDEGLQISSYALLDPGSAGAEPLREMLRTPASEMEAVGYFPDSTLAFYAVNLLDAPRIYDFALAYLRDASRVRGAAGDGADAAAMVDSGIATFEAQSSLRIREDILGWMGKEAAIGLNGVVKGGFFPVPQVSLIIQSTDQARAKAFFEKLEAQIARAVQSSGQPIPIQFQQADYKGVAIRFAPTPLGEGLAPAYALHDDYAVVALSRGALQRMLDAKTGATPAVGSAAEFKALSGFYPGEANLVGFANTAQLMTEVGTALTTFQQMSGQASAQTQDTMTKVIEAFKNVQSVGSYGVSDDGGVEQRFLVRVR